jgi:hypothetical protein
MGVKWHKAQVTVLAIGTLFSWTTLVLDYRHFFDSGGRVFEFSGCAVANPLATPCFYGALAFAIALLWSVAVVRAAPDAVLRLQGGLHWLLVAGTLFAWGNLGYELYRYLQPQPTASAFSCPVGDVAPNPLATPCFYGALIFACALMVSTTIRRSSRRSP